MTSPTTLQAQQLSKPGRRSRRVAEGEEFGKKTKKANSEIRKQQNRIASRNYREKRKRKLQYLQQLIKDGSNDEDTPKPSPQQHEAHFRSLSADYNAGPGSSPFLLPSNSNFAPLSSSGTTALGPVPAASDSSYDGHLLPTTQPYPPFESSWNSLTYEPPPPPSLAYEPAWITSIEYASRLAPRQELFHFSTPVVQAAFEPATSPYHHPQDALHHPDHYALSSPYGHYNGLQSQSAGIPSVSLPTPSSYFQGHYPGPH